MSEMGNFETPSVSEQSLDPNDRANLKPFRVKLLGGVVYPFGIESLTEYPVNLPIKESPVGEEIPNWPALFKKK